MVLIPFDPGIIQFDRNDRWQWWDSMRSWFAERGYTLYDYLPDGDSDNKFAYWKPSRHCTGSIDFPYPYMGSDDDRTGYATGYGEGRVVFAQDNEGRHLAIKLLKGGSEEVKVSKLLKDESCLHDFESFPCVLPVLDLLPCEDHWFAVMPRSVQKRPLSLHVVVQLPLCRWGEVDYTPWFSTMYHAVLHMRCLLKGLIFLQSRRIFHRDVAHRNILVNRLAYFRDRRKTFSMQFELEKEEKLRYALFDFDRAVLLDKETYGENPILPIHFVNQGFYSPPYERLLGYPDFDPFKYDVACLGIYFDETFGDHIPAAPLLAPLIDRMLTANIEKRFTASQALDFTEYILSNVSRTIPTYDKPRIWMGSYYDRDRWKDLPEDFVTPHGHPIVITAFPV
ncbi:kinase-like domain-containing protein [Gymnopilus junonius]|uniref:Kinase-like domain-containing protein n=1 Tax=Gymnopilus junonius TaxID=109634 RepID=A0A9P5NFL4_GYMJU|nr:kinase-like domain-containing protein [Gymnopilus junonius]